MNASINKAKEDRDWFHDVHRLIGSRRRERFDTQGSSRGNKRSRCLQRSSGRRRGMTYHDDTASGVSIIERPRMRNHEPGEGHGRKER